jgi:hypothetical protein
MIVELRVDLARPEQIVQERQDPRRRIRQGAAGNR